jgi:protoporphyrinogen oxidase
MTNRTCIVVGGGLIGLLASYLATKLFEKVILIERSESLGGLLGSFERKGSIYDYGTHLPAFTNIADLDEILYGNINERKCNYQTFPYLRSENFFMGQWNLSSPLPDTRGLLELYYNKGVRELLQAPGADEGVNNLYEYLLLTFGFTFTEKIYRPIFKKLLASELEDLHKNVLSTFGIQRLIALTSDVTKELKIIPKYDKSLGYHSYIDGSPPTPYCYPKGNNGIGFLPKQLLEKVMKAGVEVITERSVKRINYIEDKIISLETDNDNLIPCSHVFWTLAPAQVLRAANLNINSQPPRFRTHTLCHFEFEKPLLKKIPQYLLCWDDRMISYRITLYPNIRSDSLASEHYNLTVEVLSDETAEKSLDIISNRVLLELNEMEIVDSENTVIDSITRYIGPSFPVMTETFLSNAIKIQKSVSQNFSNITLLGRAAGTSFFINDLLIETYDKVKNLEMN